MKTRILIKHHFAFWAFIFLTGVVGAATISRIKTFSDGDILTASDLNVEFNNVVDGVNSISNDNVATNAAIVPSKISASIKGSAITRNSTTGALSVSVDDTTIEISGDAIQVKAIPANSASTASIQNNAVTRAKIAVIDQIPAGTVVMFYTYNGATDIPRGWMKMDGDIINETNYNINHGAGAYAADGVASSPLLGKHLPDMDERYATGNDTTSQTGASAITAVGNSGSTVNISHTHSRGSYAAQVSIEDNKIYINQEASSAWTADRDATPTSTTAVGAAGRDEVAVIQGTSGSSLSSSQSIRPDSIQFIFIMKVI